MAVDPFLFYHKVSENHVNIGGRWHPLSIRDQMLRGRWAVERVLPILDENHDELAIVGAGVGGVTAAMTAVTAGIKTTLFEAANHPFARHARCGRWVDPTQYDWPLEHFTQGRVPWPNTPPLPLQWRNPGRAFALVGDWRIQFQIFLQRYRSTGLFPWRPNSSVLALQAVQSGVQLTWGEQKKPQQKTFRLVVSAMGFGEERSYLTDSQGDPASHFRGYPFWDSDPFENPNLSWTGKGEPPRVLISGGGDGALQDFIRVTTKCRSARELLDCLRLSVKRRATVQKRAQDAEDQAVRALVWSNSASADCPILNRLMADFQSLADELYQLAGVQRRLNSIIRDDFKKLWFVHPCKHFTVGYALNRLLVLLLMKHLRQTEAPFVHKPDFRVVEVRCNGHPGPTDPGSCHGRPHGVVMWPKRDCHPDPPGSSPHRREKIEAEFDVVILRHGIIPPSQTFMTNPTVTLPPSRQLLPYHYPG